MKALQFGTGSKVYEFPGFDQTFNPRTASLTTPTTQLPGASGGFPGLGFGPAPLQVRQLSLSFRLVAGTRNEMKAKRDAVSAMATWGTQQLIGIDPDQTTRWINCKVSQITMNEDPARHTDLVQPVTINFTAADPHWYAQGTESPVWGAFIWGGGAAWGGASAPQVCTGLQTNFTITHNGTGFARPRIVITVPNGETASNIRVQRIVGGSAVDQVRYSGTLNTASSDRVLIINTRAQTVTLDAADAFSAGSWELPTNLWWFRLTPGSNSIRVLMNGAGNECTVDFKYFETYI